MSDQNQPRPGDPCWIDLYTSDVDRSIAFYGELFGWTAERADEFGGYVTFRQDGRAVAGAMGHTEDDAEAPEQWTVYLASPDIQATTDRAVARGGSVVVPPMPVGELGSMAVLGDAGGVGIGVWQAGTFRGIETNAMVTGGKWGDNEGVPSWFELHTRAYDAALDFYRDVFGWQDPFTISDADEFRYTTIHSDSPMLGGVLDASTFLPAGVPGAWSVYFGANDVDKTVAKVVELGGSVIRPAEDSEFGRLATVTDVTGARFSIGGDKA